MLHRITGFVVSVLILAAMPALGEERHALVIGNGAYQNIDPLPNPPSDARLVAQALAGVGFKVTTLINADMQAMDEAMNDFASALDNAGENTVGVFYYAGHGVSYQGENWLIPVGADIRQATHLKYRTLSANIVLGLMEAARNATDIVILDACRNSPFRGFSLSGTRAVSQGMNRMELAPSGSFIAYSTAPGKVAFDGSGEYSPFAEAFADEIATSNESIGDMMIDVRVRVKEATEEVGSEAQIPWTNSSLLGKFWFNPAKAAGDASAQIIADNEREQPIAKAPVKVAMAPVQESQPSGHREEPVRSTKLNCAAGPHNFPLELAGHNGQECMYSLRLAGLDQCTVTKVEVQVGGVRPGHITLRRSQSSKDAEYWQRTPNAAGANQWSTVNNGLNCNFPLGCGNGEYDVLLAGVTADECASFEDVRLVLSTR